MYYNTYSIRTGRNTGTSKLGVGTRCAVCDQPIEHEQNYMVHTVRTATMPAAGFHYYHVGHAPKRGSGWGAHRAGELVSDIRSLQEGDLVLEHDLQFDTLNIVRVTEGGPDQSVEIARGVFVDPADPTRPRRQSDESFCIYGAELGANRLLYRITSD